VLHGARYPRPPDLLQRPHLNPGVRQAFASLHAQLTVTYQPASRYWPLQACEAAIALALALAVLCGWKIRRLA
jgi:hypothetical protein